MKILTTIWVGALIAVSLQPLRPPAAAGARPMHRCLHLVAFGVTALMLWLLLAGARRALPVARVPAMKSGLTAVLATALLGGALEVLQHLIYHNPVEWLDVRDDATSALAVVLLGQAVRRMAVRRQTMGQDPDG